MIIVSFFKVHFFEFNILKVLKPMEQGVSQVAVVHYENLTSLDFVVNINYYWEDPTNQTSKPKDKDSNLRTTDTTTNSNQTSNTSSWMNTENEKGHAGNYSNFTVEVRPSLIWNQETKRQIEASDYEDNQMMFVMVGDLLGTIHNGRLAVEVNETYAFWNNGQIRLCQLLRDMTLKSSLDDPATNTSVLPRPLLNLTMDCEQVSKREDLGQGNWITALYCVRLAAAVAKVDYQFQCTSGRASQMSVLLPWFDGYHPAPTDEEPWPYDAELPTEREVCVDKYGGIRVDKMSHEIQKDIRRMAVELVGPQSLNIATNSLLDDEQKPLIPNVTQDEVAIHFRCGDVMGGVRRNDFGMIKFNEYPKWIWNETRSIGILTQPFDKSVTRRRDQGKIDACREAVYLLVDYLHSFYPEATINIRNSREETLPLTYARIAMARQSFTTLSSFGIFPVVGTFGEGYFQKGNRGVNPFASFIPRYLPNQHEMRAPVKSSGQIQTMGLNATLAWFVSDDDD
jgi:hypothetical protein